MRRIKGHPWVLVMGESYEDNHIEVEKEKETSHLDDEHEDNASGASTDPSRPPGFEDFKRHENIDQQSGESSHTSTMKRYKRNLVKELCYKNNVHFLGIQESKLMRLELFRLKSMWGNYSFDYACSLARGRSGGIISIWDLAMFIKTNIWCDDHFIIVQCKWTNSDYMYFMINIYGPHDTRTKATLWNLLRTFIQTHNGKVYVVWDLNKVRDESECYGSTFSQSEADCFNSFIEMTNLVEMPMGGRRFTWMNKSGTKMSKLDHFILSESIINEIQDLKATVLERGRSDHNLFSYILKNQTMVHTHLSSFIRR
ncbi:endonuclease/exonuclease/phosphatase family protein [Artemisia annua]|uniref:Endonuclease/exonuclease/phosphatase family protein n=1 Tax=Artemisia annua TaxID=35608 RepID=A0A2U1PR12_ARTAN|nr:endonuclease/exonuclease/phosphatase family protein [Artemisia annua]